MPHAKTETSLFLSSTLSYDYDSRSKMPHGWFTYCPALWITPPLLPAPRTPHTHSRPLFDYAFFFLLRTFIFSLFLVVARPQQAPFAEAAFPRIDRSLFSRCIYVFAPVSPTLPPPFLQYAYE